MTAAPKSRRRRAKVDEAPRRAIELIAKWLDGELTYASGWKSEREAAHALHAYLAAEGLQIVDAADRGRLQHEIEALRAKLATAQQDAARFAHAAEQLDEAHADAQAQLALALHWGAELVEQVRQAEHGCEVLSIGEPYERLADTLEAARLAREDFGRRLEAERGRRRAVELVLEQLREVLDDWRAAYQMRMQTPDLACRLLDRLELAGRRP